MTLYDASLEPCVIGALCIGQEKSMGEVIKFLIPDDFTTDSGKAVYELLYKKYVNSEPIDMNLMPQELKTKMADPYNYLRECMMMAPTTNNVAVHAHVIHAAAKERRLRAAVLECFDERSGTDLGATIMKKCQDYLEDEIGRSHTMYDLAMKLMDNLNKPVELTITTGFPRLDGILHGMRAGNLILIGARPSVGKTAFALELARHATKFGKVLFYSMEMTGEELGQRYLSNMSLVPLSKIINSDMDDEEVTKYVQAGAKMSEMSMIIEDGTNVTVEAIRAEAIREQNIKAIFVDYIGLMRSAGKYDNRNYELGAISRELKALAMELRIPVIVMAQLNREVKDTDEPNLNQLRDSGELEQNANKVIFLWNVDKENGIRGVKVAKNRNGKIGKVQMNFDGEHQRFIERSEDVDTDLPIEEDFNNAGYKTH